MTESIVRVSQMNNIIPPCPACSKIFITCHFVGATFTLTSWVILLSESSSCHANQSDNREGADGAGLGSIDQVCRMLKGSLCAFLPGCDAQSSRPFEAGRGKKKKKSRHDGELCAFEFLRQTLNLSSS